MSFLSNCSTFVGILLVPADLLKCNEDVTFFYCLVSGTYKNGDTVEFELSISR